MDICVYRNRTINNGGSIIAKVARDDLMKKMTLIYGFKNHKGRNFSYRRDSIRLIYYQFKLYKNMRKN